MSCPPPKVNPPVVIDNGSYTIKAGFAGNEAPRLTFRTVVGRTPDGQVFVGDECNGKSDLSLEYPIERGTIRNWEAMTEIWRYVFKTLNADPSKNPILLTEALNVSKEDREKMTRIMFETFNANLVYLANQPILSLYARGRKEGVVISSGYGVTQLVPSHEGFVVPSTSVRMDIGGYDLTKYLMDSLNQEGGNVSMDVARQIKESCCYIVPVKGTTPVDKTYKFPDGQEVVLNTARTAPTEYFLKPSFFGDINSAIVKTSEVTGMSLESLYSGIVLSGGNTVFEGMAERIEKELQALAAPGNTVTVAASFSGVNSTFIGGAILTCLDAFPPLCMTRKDYEENGPSIVHTKCK